ncbi:MAG: serine hydrolase [Halioglobus sp.]
MPRFVPQCVMPAIAALTLSACEEPAQWHGSLEAFLQGQPSQFSTVMSNPEQYRVQIIYTQIDRDINNAPTFTSYKYRLNESEYFYPASTIKLPTALVALQAVSELAGEGVTRDTQMVIEGRQESAPLGVEPSDRRRSPTSVGDEVNRILLVSDNDAYNNLYEFVGYERLNQQLQQLSLPGTRIVHKLEVTPDEIENRRTHAVRFFEGGQTLYSQKENVSSSNYAAQAPVVLGKGEIVEDALIQKPKDFSGKNAFPLQAQHDLIQALMFPDFVSVDRRLPLSEDDLHFVRKAMSTYPTNSDYTEYADQKLFPDGFVKFLMYGGDQTDIPDHIRIMNKSGQAYGFLADAAYIADLKNGVEFILAATIYTNANGIFNDDLYEYDSIGFPFLRNLGTAIYELELTRDREITPDLRAFDLR